MSHADDSPDFFDAMHLLPNLLPCRLATCLLAAACCALAPLPAAAEVVMVNIDNFADANRERGAAAARQAIAERKVVLYTDMGFPFPGLSAARQRQRDREIAMRINVIERLGLIPEMPPGSGCIIEPGLVAYADGYAKVANAYIEQKFGADFRDRIEAEVKRRLKAQNRRRPKS